jgi:hypothetical protein
MSHALQCERLHRLPQKRPLTLVSVLQSPAALEIVNIRLSRDFQGPFDLRPFSTVPVNSGHSITAHSEIGARRQKFGISIPSSSYEL